MSFEDINPLLTLLLGGGGATAIQTFWKGWRTWREGASAREDNAKLELVQYRRDLIRRAEYAEDLATWQNDELGRAHYMLRINGIDVPDPVRPKPTRPADEGEVSTR